jgi:hypothetical protein
MAKTSKPAADSDAPKGAVIYARELALGLTILETLLATADDVIH